jgi:O-antigen ligase
MLHRSAGAQRTSRRGWTLRTPIVYRGPMRATTIYQDLRNNGDIAAAGALAGCLVYEHWTLGVLLAFLGLVILTSRFYSLWAAIRNYDRSFFASFKGKYYNTRFVYICLFFGLLLYHSDGLSGMETPLKGMFIAYVMALNTDRFRWPVLIYGCAAAAILALVFGMLQVGISAAERTGGGTNAIRFGMIALALGSVCAVGFLYERDSRGRAVLSLIGFLCGTGAAFASGSRGALLALPFILLLLAPVVWRRSKRAFVTVAVFLAIFAGGLLSTNVGQMATRIVTAYTNITLLLTTGEAKHGSVGDRTKLLVLAYQLFREHPLLGVGAHGWNEAAIELARAPDKTERVGYPYNQAHNQYADDLAKGGIVRFVLGFLILFLPLYYFLKCEPFSGAAGSEFALAGLVVSVAFMIFSLSESMMLLSLPTTVHAVLTFYLLGACDEERGKAASEAGAVGDASGPSTERGALAMRAPLGRALATA